MPKAMIDSLLAISESVAATRYPDHVKQLIVLSSRMLALLLRSKQLLRLLPLFKPKKSKGKPRSPRLSFEDIDDDVSVFDDSEFPMTGSGEVDEPYAIDTERLLDAHASISPPDYEGFFKKFAQLLNNCPGLVTADFPVPPLEKA
ncbi:hypothetical protein B0H14DRAFT_2658771 [Mycena olivaceomarginata]|nr:hypothetical protein B0H14DRAFT_2658771 [Mycena olivaceomarginata]